MMIQKYVCNFLQTPPLEIFSLKPQFEMKIKYHKIRYSDPNQNLTLSDWDIISGKEEVKNEGGGKYEALIIEMSLNSSTYATMALREVTRMDTGKTYQTALTDKHQEEANSEKIVAGIKRGISDNDVPEILDQCKLPKIEEETISKV